MRIQVLATLLGAADIVTAQVSSFQDGITYSVSVPDQTATSGSGDIYIQITGPTSNAWIGFGQGSQMSGAKMFIIYSDSTGRNVTLSPRKGAGHSQPSFDPSAQVVLLGHSGISNGVMTANIKCSDCKDLTSTSSNWIYAALVGSALQDDSQSASIQQHASRYGSMILDMSKAKGGPIFGAGTSSTSSTTSSALTVRETVTATATTTTTSIAAPSPGLPNGTKAGIAVTFAIIFLILLGAFIYWKRSQKAKQEDDGPSSKWKKVWNRMRGHKYNHDDPTWQKAEIDGNEVKPSELEGVRIHELHNPPRVHQLNTDEQPVEMQG